MLGSVKGMVAVAVVVIGLTACGTMRTATTEQTSQTSLYERLGRREGITLVVTDFLANASASPRIGARFKALPPAQVEKVKTNISDFICDAAGGPCSYLGRPLKEVHAPMKLTQADWDACVDALSRAAEKNGVSAQDRSALLGLLAPYMKDIVSQ